MSKMRICFFDLETSNLNANFGFILCAGWKFLGEKQVYCSKISDYKLYKSDPTNDRELVKATAAALSEADLWVGHYASRFDVPYLNSRLLHHGLAPMPKTPLIDTWRVAKYGLRLNSNRLQTVCEFLGLEDKTPIKGPHWVKAMAGNKSSLKYIVDHCIQDVLVLEQAYIKLRPLIPNHPNVNIITDVKDGCPTCGSRKLHKRGMTYTRVFKKQRYQCQECGTTSYGVPSRIEGLKIK